ncbi:MAG: glycosyltransferase family 47 protein [Verrucomicrobiota bacterium]|nr:glycosyltransferase family 47 protein [Verrucomicrobiota bacterium]
MAKVLLLSATPRDDETDYNRAPFEALRASAGLDRFRRHTLEENPFAADVILFAEYYGGGFHFERIRAHSILRRHRRKCFLFCSNAIVIPFLPGIYASLEKSWSSRRTCGGFYLGLPKNEFTTFTSPDDNLPYLLSFMGSVTNAAVRRELARLSHPRAFFQNTADDFSQLLHGEMSARDRRDYYRRYAELTKASKFVLCPRGLGASTVRLFETMRMGRVPVILSDEWVPPEGPRWEEFSIRVAENETARIPQLLEEREHMAVAMGKLARREWEEWFSEEVAFHRVVEYCLALRERRRVPETLARWPIYLQLLRPFHLRRLLRRKYDELRAWLKRSRAPRPHLAGNEV